ncbi:hypothetical protein NNC19_13195 [Clostridium sp. SHJSY1]|uniref:capsular polysaccharide export protein, LipB/KpsS family n=1 Tax=Clostridium sp. SHJSY1 TaxID=2942483 RepID=UPI0028770912|nr:hypothetical protein [Clostridium sp. SHJSY1]MDS0526641.1 hypothetical protein [Clostridium sp. SHJSY1]
MKKNINIFVNENDREIKYDSVESILKDESLHKLSELALKTSKNWFKDGEVSLIQKDGVDLGSLLQIKSFFIIERYLKLNEMLEIVMLNDCDINLLIKDMNDWNILSVISKRYGEDLNLKKCFSEYKLNNAKGIVKVLGLEYIMKFFTEKEPSDSFNNTANVIIQEINNKSMISMMEILENEMNSIEFTTICFGSNMYKLANNKSKTVIGNKSYLLEISRINKKLKMVMGNEKIASHFNDLIQGDEYSLKWFENHFIKIMRSELIGLELYRKSLEDYFQDNNVKNILLPSDSHAISRLVCQVAKKYNILTYVLQHGSIGELAFTPIYADYFLAWGKQAEDYLVSKGESKDKIVIVGNVKYEANKFYTNSSSKPFKMEKILWTINNVADDINRNLFNVLEEVLEENGESTLILKLHPGESNKDWFYDLVNHSDYASRITICDRTFNTLTLIEESDLVVITQSTTGLESMMLKRPVCLYKDSRIPNIIPYEEFDSVIKFTNKEDFLNNLKRTDFNELYKNSDKLLESYMQPFKKDEFVKWFRKKH